MTLASPLSRFGSPGFAAVWSTDAEIPRVLNVPFPVTFKIDKPYTEDMSFNVSSPDIQFQNCLVEVKKGFTTAVAMAQLLKPQLLPLETKKTATVQVRQISSSHTTVQAVPLALATVSDSPSQLSSIGSGSNITEFNGQPSHNIQHPGWYQAIKSELINLQVQFQPCGNSPHEQCLVELRDHPYLTVLITVYQDAVTKTANGLCGQLSAADFQENKSPSIRKAPLDFIHALEQSRNVPYNAESSETTDYLQDWRIPDGIQIQFPE
ncbi:hypothetical protein RI367_002659 [Sorochytrium milnesiophthora]